MTISFIPSAILFLAVSAHAVAGNSHLLLGLHTPHPQAQDQNAATIPLLLGQTVRWLCESCIRRRSNDDDARTLSCCPSTNTLSLCRPLCHRTVADARLHTYPRILFELLPACSVARGRKFGEPGLGRRRRLWAGGGVAGKEGAVERKEGGGSRSRRSRRCTDDFLLHIAV